MTTSTLSRQMQARRLFATAAVVCISSNMMAQAPSSLSYPTPNVFIANVSNVFLSPNLAGNATSYAINPALPAGLSFNTSTGVISGVPTAASAATVYTVTANGAGATSTSVTSSIQVTNNYFNNNYATISFGGTGVTLINGNTGATISSSTTTTVGTAAGDIVVYKNVVTLSGQPIDCIVKTVSVSSGTTVEAYDQNEASGSNWSSNDPKFFAPQFTFPAGTANTVAGAGGNAQFNFQFILGNSYSTTSHTGTPVVLQNVRINTYDIDGNGANFSNQYNEFGGFSTSEVGSGSTLQAPVYNSTTGLTTYRSNSTTNVTSVVQDATRVRLTYSNMSDFSIRVGGGGLSYFFLDFSAGPGFSTAVVTPTPSVDLDTDVIGVNNAGSGCGTSLSFTHASQSNITATGDLTQLRVSFPTADILNGSSEQIVVNGATNGTIALNADPSINNLTLGGVVYTVAGSTASGVRTLIFTRNSGTFTVANAEALLDALQYNNTNTTPTPGSRDFTVNVRNAAFQSPNAVFTATLDCVSISGHVYHDISALVDSTVNATGASQFAAGAVYVVRVNPVNNQVIDSKAIATGGAYTFGTVSPGSYAFYVSTTAPAPGSVFTAANFPAGYIPTGENLGATAGNDHQTDGKLLITIGSISITDANFGLEIPPTTANSTFSGIANPGGFNAYPLPVNTFTTNDTDGNIDSIRINSFPTGANYIKIGSTVYTNGGTCPPQVVTCTPWPGSVNVPFSGGNPVPVVSVDPTLEGTATVVINFAAYDDGRIISNNSDVTLNFVGGISYLTLGGKVWNDANGNGIQAGTEATVAPADAGQTLYALLIQTTRTYSGAPTILASSVVNSTTGYTFSNVPANNDYTIQIVSLATAPTSGAAASTVNIHLASGWTGVSTNADGTIAANQNTGALSIALANLSTSKSNQNFGIDRIPDATSATTSVPQPVVGTLYTLNGIGGNPPIPVGTDTEDGALGATNTIVITSLPVYTTLLYNNIAVTVGQVITDFDPSKLKVQVTVNTTGQTGTSFQFSYKDAAGVPDPTPATYTLNWLTPLPVKLGAFTATAENGKAKLNWVTYTEEHNKGFAIERSIDSRNWKQIEFVNSIADGGMSTTKEYYVTYDNQPQSGANYYRLKQTDMDGAFTYSEIKQLTFGRDNSISIYPNPAKDMVNVKVADWSKVAAVRILDVNGKILFQTQNASNGISLGAMANGNYILQLEHTNGQLDNFNLVKQ